MVQWVRGGEDAIFRECSVDNAHKRGGEWATRPTVDPHYQPRSTCLGLIDRPAPRTRKSRGKRVSPLPAAGPCSPSEAMRCVLCCGFGGEKKNEKKRAALLCGVGEAKKTSARQVRRMQDGSLLSHAVCCFCFRGRQQAAMQLHACSRVEGASVHGLHATQSTKQ